MPLSISTAMANRFAGKPVSVVDAGSQISFTSPSTISTTQNDFLTAGFRPGMAVNVTSGGASTNAGFLTVASVASDGSTITTVEASITTEAAAVDTPTLRGWFDGLGWEQAFRYGILGVYDGNSMPADADLAETGTLLLLATVDGLTLTPGTSTNGIQFDFDSVGKIIIHSGDIISGLGLADGTAYYARYYDNAYIIGDDSSNLASPRVQGRIGLASSNLDFDITSTDIRTGVSDTVTAFNWTQRLND